MALESVARRARVNAANALLYAFMTVTCFAGP